MPSPPIVFDGLRLFLGAFCRTPRGVDRVDFSYARFLFENWPNECLGLLPTPWGCRLYDRQRALRLLGFVETVWREGRETASGSALADLRAWLTGKPAAVATKPSSSRPSIIQCGWRSFAHNGLRLGRSVVAKAPKNAVYLNVGQVGWAAPAVTHWIRKRNDVNPVFLLHDVIPLQHPGLVSSGGRLSQDWMLSSVLRKASGLITTTRAASDTVMATLRERGLPEIPVQAMPLPVADIFLQKQARDEELAGHPYFVICGAIEPRKNHLLLLKVWQSLVQRVGPGAPRLVVVGTPAHQGQQIAQALREAPGLSDHVRVVSGLASPDLRTIIASAAALLMPSFAEGFGLPVVEALAVGTPVLASDIPAHREVGEDLAIYLDPTDDIAWFDAILDVVEDQETTIALRRRIQAYQPVTPGGYFSGVQAFLDRFG